MKKILCYLAAAVTFLAACVCTSSCTELIDDVEKGVYTFSLENVVYKAEDSEQLEVAEFSVKNLQEYLDVSIEGYENDVYSYDDMLELVDKFIWAKNNLYFSADVYLKERGTVVKSWKITTK